MVGVDIRSPALGINGALFIVRISATDELCSRRSDIRRCVTVGEVDGTALRLLVVERAAHAAKANDGRAIGCGHRVSSL